MQINPSMNVHKGKANSFTSNPVKKPQAQILFFTGGKPSSQELSDVITIANKVSKDNLSKYLDDIAGPQTEGRGVGQVGIEKAKDYIGQKFKEFGLQPVKELGLNNYFETFKMPQYPVRSMQKGPYIYGSLNRWGGGKEVDTSNVLGMIKGSEKPDEYIIVCGHYDHLGKEARTGRIFPGANDDASGVVAMLETARIMSQGPAPKKSVIFAALTGEESGWMGANQLAKDLVAKGMAKKVEVFNIEMIAAMGGDKIEFWDQKMPEAGNMVKNLKKAAKELGIKAEGHHEVDPGSDSIRFSTYDIPALCMVWDFDMEKNHSTYHCAEDTPKTVDKNIFYEAAKVAAASSYLIANDTTPRPEVKPSIANLKRMKELQAYRQNALTIKNPL